MVCELISCHLSSPQEQGNYKDGESGSKEKAVETVEEDPRFVYLDGKVVGPKKRGPLSNSPASLGEPSDSEGADDQAILQDLRDGNLQNHLPTLQDLAELKMAGFLPKKSFDKMEKMGMISGATASRMNAIKMVMKKPTLEQKHITSYFVKGKSSSLSLFEMLK